MIPFTKEELEEMKRCLKYMINGGTTPYSSLTMSLHKKVKYLIDTHCIHLNQQMDCDGGISMVCKDCGITTMDI